MNSNEAVQRAITSLKLSGFTFTDESLRDWHRVGRDEMTTEEFRRKIIESIPKRQAGERERF